MAAIGSSLEAESSVPIFLQQLYLLAARVSKEKLTHVLSMTNHSSPLNYVAARVFVQRDVSWAIHVQAVTEERFYWPIERPGNSYVTAIQMLMKLV